MFHSEDHQSYQFLKWRRSDWKRQEIPTKFGISFIEQLLPKSRILFSAAGEFLMSPMAIDYIEYAGRCGHTPMLLTNGLLLTSDISARLLDLGVSTFIISIDGWQKDFYDNLRLRSDFQTVINNVAQLRRLRDQKSKAAIININSILLAQLEPYKEEIVSFWTDKVDQLSFLAERLDYCGAPRKTIIEPPPVKLCFALLEGPLLLSNGLVAPCCSTAIGEWFEPMPWLLSVEHVPLTEIVRSYREMMLNDDSPLRLYCRKCHFGTNSYWQNGKSSFCEIHQFVSTSKINR
ncbi:MAG: hypothetical protein HQK58_03290 [Deltaproteobacteria bacterium]|nr:hypothetical protein [Deltaproteobacteria bacterium]